jgi:DivIVA domain-containing protein
MITAEDVLATTFTTTKFRGGYDIEEVDDFLDRIAGTLATLEGTKAATTPLLSAKDVLAQQFATVKLREGYTVKDVDDFLDRIAAQLNEYAQKAVATGALPAVTPNDAPTPALAEASSRGSVGSSTGLTPAAAARAQDVPSALSNLPEGAALGLRVLTQQLQIATVRTQGSDGVTIRTPDGATLRVVAVDASPTGVVLRTAP